MSSIEVFGKPGSGKTAYMTANAADFLNRSEQGLLLQQACMSRLNALNGSGDFHFTLPDRPPIYSNYPIRVQCGTYIVGSYYVDGFHLGFENEYVPVYPILPEARIYLSEAQRYYNSRRSKDLPDWVSRFFEEHRHHGLEIFLDVQRPGLIDLNIRELVSRFVEVAGMEHKTDSAGNILATKFHLRVFDDWKHVEKYLDGTGERYTEEVYHYTGCVFDCYESKAYARQFIPEAMDFAKIEHVYGEHADSLNTVKNMYQQTPPEGYYNEKKGGNRRGQTERALL